jgi:peptidoglycan/xylan/chitin deacetylase (PgdA/CDA1 family)
MKSRVVTVSTLIIVITLFIYYFKNPERFLLKKNYDPDSILKACWTMEQLEGSVSEKIIKKNLKNIPFDLDIPLKENIYNEKLLVHAGKSIRRVKLPKDQKLVALTFDLCESKNEVSGYDNEIVNYLRVNNIRATFFASGKWMRSHSERTMQLMADHLFELGSHAWTHRNFSVIDEAEMNRQLAWTQLQYQHLRDKLEQMLPSCGISPNNIKQIPETMNLFRFPFGICNDTALTKLKKFNLSAIQWDVVSSDPIKNQTAEKIAKRVLKGIKPGSIVVMHANGKGYNTAKFLEIIIPELIKQGYGFATVNELFRVSEQIESVDICYELTPGDNLIYNVK